MQGLVTVFGGTGFVGRYVVRALARDGWRIRVAVRNPNGAPELKVMGEVGQIEFTRCNIRDPAQVDRALDGAQAVVNLVAVLFEGGPQTFDELHAKAAKVMAEQAAGRGITRFVHISAIGADPDSLAEYGRTKAAGEAAVRAAIPEAVILRPSIVFGPEDKFFNRFAAMAALSPALPLIGGGNTRFQPVYSGDVGAAVAGALANGDAAGRTFELGGPGVYTFRQLMEIMLHDIQRRRMLIPLPFPLAAPLGQLGDLQAKLLPMLSPVITTDQLALLKSDNVAAEGAPGLAALGVEATPLEAVLPTYLWRFRDGGQFAQPGGHNAASPQGGPSKPHGAAGSQSNPVSG